MKTSFVSILSAMLLASACTQSVDPLVVTTDAGQVKGIEQEGSIAFLGIPYAHTERFMPPQPVTPWDTVRLCDHFGPQAMQNVGNRQLSEDEMSEQCCVLNVWTTDLQAHRPVMLWLHGGGFDSGTSAWDPGMCLAHEDVVVVSVNHRLNILGFLDLSAADSAYRYSANVGMLDVVQALHWIHDNISRFGGDPQNVTVFGESGGGAARSIRLVFGLCASSSLANSLACESRSALDRVFSAASAGRTAEAAVFAGVTGAGLLGFGCDGLPGEGGVVFSRYCSVMPGIAYV